MTSESQPAIERIRAEYQRREREIAPDFYALHHPANLFARHAQERGLLWALQVASAVPLAERRILDVGCGTGQFLGIFEDFGARRENLAGIDLDDVRGAMCLERFGGADVRVGDAAHLPWEDCRFDLVFQSTVFTSILEPHLKQAVASEMLRVLKPTGAVLWYDFLVNNPNNKNVRGVGRREIEVLFPRCRVHLRRVTLAPPIARRLVRWSWTMAAMLQSLRVLNTHYIGVIEPIGARSG